MNYKVFITATMLQLLSLSASANVIHEYLDGKMYKYNKKTKRIDIETNYFCSLKLQLDKVYPGNDTQLKMNYELSTDANIKDKYLTGIAQSSTCNKSPDRFCGPTTSLGGFFEGSFLNDGVRVAIHFSSEYYLEDVTQFDTIKPDVERFFITSSNAMSSYFGGDGTSWSYLCEFQPQ